MLNQFYCLLYWCKNCSSERWGDMQGLFGICRSHRDSLAIISGLLLPTTQPELTFIYFWLCSLGAVWYWQCLTISGLYPLENERIGWWRIKQRFLLTCSNNNILWCGRCFKSTFWAYVGCSHIITGSTVKQVLSSTFNVSGAVCVPVGGAVNLQRSYSPLCFKKEVRFEGGGQKEIIIQCLDISKFPGMRKSQEHRCRMQRHP